MIVLGVNKKSATRAWLEKRYLCALTKKNPASQTTQTMMEDIQLKLSEKIFFLTLNQQKLQDAWGEH